MIAGDDRAPSDAPKLAQLGLERAAVDELEQLEAAIAGDREHRTERRLDPRGGEEAPCRARWPGVSPNTRANAARKPLSDSKPASRPASSVGDPSWSAFIAVPSRQAR